MNWVDCFGVMGMETNQINQWMELWALSATAAEKFHFSLCFPFQPHFFEFHSHSIQKKFSLHSIIINWFHSYFISSIYLYFYNILSSLQSINSKSWLKRERVGWLPSFGWLAPFFWWNQMKERTGPAKEEQSTRAAAAFERGASPNNPTN